MKASFIQKTLIFSFLIPLATVSSVAMSQNYVDARNYASPNVVVDLTVLDTSKTPSFAQRYGQERTMPAPAMRGRSGIRTPQGVVSRAGSSSLSVLDEQPQMQEIIVSSEPVKLATTQEPPKNEVVLRQDIKAPIKKAPNAYKNVKITTPTDKPVAIISSELPPEQQLSKPVKMANIKKARKSEIKKPKKLDSSVVSLSFVQDGGQLSSLAEQQLQSVVSTLKTSVAKRVQIKAYASGTPETANKARRLSLTRALNARSYLLKQGVKPTQIDVRALGIGNAIDKPTREGVGNDRIDLVFLN